MPSKKIFALASVLFFLITIKQTFQLDNEIDEIDAEKYILNLHYDHCARPMTFSWKRRRCECPLPMKRVGHRCVCAECELQHVQQWFFEGFSDDLPNYINEVFEELAIEMKDGEKTLKEEREDQNRSETKPNSKGTDRGDGSGNDLDEQWRKKRSLETQWYKIRSPRNGSGWLNQQLLDFVLPKTKMSSGARRSINQIEERVITPISQNSPFLKYHRMPKTHLKRGIQYNRRFIPDEKPKTSWISVKNTGWKGNRRNLDYSMDTKKVKLLKLRKKSNPNEPKPQTFSDSVVAGEMRGNASSGTDRSVGHVSSLRGTGALSLGAGGGSAGAAAFTGLGSSYIAIQSKGASAGGEAYIGEMARDGSSTISLLYGSGDAIAVNSLGGRGSSSAAGFSTSRTAGAATSAFGPASASVSAAPGKGGASSSADFSDGLNTVAAVDGDTYTTVVESAAVGNPDQDISQLRKKPNLHHFDDVKFEATGFDFQSIFTK